MASVQRATRYITLEEHERIERATGEKHEWCDGEVFSMAGASPTHNTIAANVLAVLRNQLLDSDCQPWGSDQPVRIPEQRALVYPDVVLACPPLEYDDVRRNALLNPRAIVEVLSPSTGGYDRTGNFARYRSVRSLRDFVLIFSDKRLIEHYARQDDGSWLLREAGRGAECVTLSSVPCRLCLDDVYRRLLLPHADARDEEPTTVDASASP